MTEMHLSRPSFDNLQSYRWSTRHRKMKRTNTWIWSQHSRLAYGNFDHTLIAHDVLLDDVHSISPYQSCFEAGNRIDPITHSIRQFLVCIGANIQNTSVCQIVGLAPQRHVHDIQIEPRRCYALRADNRIFVANIQLFARSLLQSAMRKSVALDSGPYQSNA